MSWLAVVVFEEEEEEEEEENVRRRKSGSDAVLLEGKVLDPRLAVEMAGLEPRDQLASAGVPERGTDALRERGKS